RSGTLILQPGKCSLSEIVADAVQSCGGLASMYEIRVETEVADLDLEADRLRIVQVLTNLISNAIKFSNRGDFVLVKGRKSGNDIVIDVIDKGRGIPPEKLTAIFNKFEQVQESDAHEKGGSGLGLSICKVLVEL